MFCYLSDPYLQIWSNHIIAPECLLNSAVIALDFASVLIVTLIYSSASILEKGNLGKQPVKFKMKNAS